MKRSTVTFQIEHITYCRLIRLLRSALRGAMQISYSEQ
jgi:hypothetical protein